MRGRRATRSRSGPGRRHDAPRTTAEQEVAPVPGAPRPARPRAIPTRLPTANVVVTSRNRARRGPSGPGSPRTGRRSRTPPRGEVHRPDHDRQRPQQPMAEQVAAGPRGCRRPRSSARPAGPARTTPRAGRGTRRRWRTPRPTAEREPDRDAGQDPAERRPDELVHRQLDGVQPAVCLAEPVPLDDAGHDRLRGGVEQRLAHAEHERRDVQQGQVDEVADDRERDHEDTPLRRIATRTSSDDDRGGRRAHRRTARRSATAGARRTRRRRSGQGSR